MLKELLGITVIGIGVVMLARKSKNMNVPKGLDDINEIGPHPHGETMYQQRSDGNWIKVYFPYKANGKDLDGSRAQILS